MQLSVKQPNAIYHFPTNLTKPNSSQNKPNSFNLTYLRTIQSTQTQHTLNRPKTSWPYPPKRNPTHSTPISDQTKLIQHTYLNLSQRKLTQSHPTQHKATQSNLPLLQPTPTQPNKPNTTYPTLTQTNLI